MSRFTPRFMQAMLLSLALYLSLDVLPRQWEEVRRGATWQRVDATIVSANLERVASKGHRGANLTKWCPRLDVIPAGASQSSRLGEVGCANYEWVGREWLASHYAPGQVLKVLQSPSDVNRVQLSAPSVAWVLATLLGAVVCAGGVVAMSVAWVLDVRRRAMPPPAAGTLPPRGDRDIQHPVVAAVMTGVQILLYGSVMAAFVLGLLILTDGWHLLLIILAVLGLSHWLEERALAPLRPIVIAAPKPAISLPDRGRASLVAAGRGALLLLLIPLLLLSFLLWLLALTSLFGDSKDVFVAVIFAMTSLLPGAGVLSIVRLLRKPPASAMAP